MRKYHKHQDCHSQNRQDRIARRRRNSRSGEDVFRCRHCHHLIGPLPSGGHHRNHCPMCLYSRHVDNTIGDRLSECRARMEPIGFFQRPNGEYVLVHRCLGCGLERFNRIAADDNFDFMLTLPELPPRTAHEVKQEQLQLLLQNWNKDSSSEEVQM